MSPLELECRQGITLACDALKSWSFAELYMTIGVFAVIFWGGWIAYSRWCDWCDRHLDD